MKNKLRVWFLLVLVAALTLGMGSIGYGEQSKNPLALDMVIIIENSSDMNVENSNENSRKIDPNGLRFDAAAALIGMCDAQYSRATYFLFNKDLYLYSLNQQGNVMRVDPNQISLFNISLPKNNSRRQSMINELNGEKIRSGYGTKKGSDIGKALSAAVDVQMRDNNGNRKVILLLATGKISIGGDRALAAASREMAIEARNRASENGIEIYAVALKDNTAGELMQQLATREGNYQYAADAEDLTEVYRNFFADMIGANPLESKAVKQDDGSSVVELTVPNDSVAEVNIILPKKNVEDPKLYSYDGTVLKADTEKLLINESRNFISYKLISPVSQTYRLVYDAVDDSDVVIQYVFSYGVQTEGKISKDKINKHESVSFQANYTFDGDPAKDIKLYDIPATLIVRKDGRIVEEVQMNPIDGNNGKIYTYTFDSLEKYGTGQYTADIHFDGNGLQRDAETINFELVNNAPILKDKNVSGDSWTKDINIPKLAETYELQSFSWDLNTFIEDPNGDGLSASVVSVPDGLDAIIENGMTLKVTTRKDTAVNGTVLVSVTDDEGAASPELSFPIKINNFEDKYRSYKGIFEAVEGVEKNSTCDLKLMLYDQNGDRIQGDDQLPGSVDLVITHDNQRQEIILNSETYGVWTGSFATDDKSTVYQITTKIPVGQVVIPVETISVNSGNIAPSLITGAKDRYEWEVRINNPEDENTYVVQENKWTLTDIIEDKNGDKLTFVLNRDKSNADVDASINENVLVIATRLNQETDGDIVVECKDNDETAGPEISFHVHVVSMEEKYKNYTAELNANGRAKSKTITFTLSVKDGDGMLVTGDTNLPEKLDASVVKGIVTSPMEMTRGEDGKWTGTLDTDDKEIEYTVSAKVHVSRNIDIIAPDYVLSTQNTAPVVSKELSESGIFPDTLNIEPFLIWSNATKDVVVENLNDFFMDKDGDKLIYSVNTEGLNGAAEAVVEGDKLTLRGLTAIGNPVSFTVTATDNEGLTVVSAPVSFKVNSLKSNGIKILIMIAAAIILLLILHQIMKPSFHSQYFEVYSRKNGGEYTDQSDRTHRFLNGKKKVKLIQYVSAAAKQSQGADSSIFKAISNIQLQPAYSSAVKVKVLKDVGVSMKVGTETLDMKHQRRLGTDGSFIEIEDNSNNSVKLVLKGVKKPSAPTSSQPQMTQNGTVKDQPVRSGRSSSRT